MTISIGTSAPPSARHTHAVWLRLREESPELADRVRRGEALEEGRNETGLTRGTGAPAPSRPAE